jgi:hypothetical protein
MGRPKLPDKLSNVDVSSIIGFENRFVERHYCHGHPRSGVTMIIMCILSTDSLFTNLRATRVQSGTPISTTKYECLRGECGMIRTPVDNSI